MRVAMFSSKPYDHPFFDALNHEYELVYLEPHLTAQTAILADGCQAVCCFVNDTLASGIGRLGHHAYSNALRRLQQC